MRITLATTLLALTAFTGCRTAAIDNDGDGYDVDADCDDNDGAVNPDATETCNGVDDDCNGMVDDEATDSATFYEDADGDGAGSDAATTTACDAPDGYAATSDDCDDSDAAINPSATETCDDADNDCDSEIDESDASDAADWYADVDEDGFGDSSSSTKACDQPTGHVADDTDCDDSTDAVKPGADEICNDIDDNCDGVTDTDAIDRQTYYGDSDGDGAGGTALTVDACESPTDFVSNSDDCDDDDEFINPSADEVCDGEDNDCDTVTDEPDATDALTWYLDDDGDGYGIDTTTDACDQPSGYAADTGDCDDDDDLAFPGAPDYPADTFDDDCSGADYEPLVYTVDRNDGSVWAIDRLTGAIVWTGNMGADSIDITVGPDGTLYTSRLSDGGISEGTADGTTWTTLTASGIAGAHGLNYDFDNDVILAAGSGGGVYEVDPADGTATLLVTVSGDQPIDAMRLAGDERVWIVGRGTGQLYAYTPSTTSLDVVVTLPVAGNLITPAQDGGLYISAPGSIMHVDIRRGTARIVGDTGVTSYGACADPLGTDNLILGDHTSALHTFDTVTGAVGSLATGLGQTWGCAIDTAADLDQDGHVNIAMGGDDCDDMNPDVFPGAVDDSFDGMDWNCDWSDGEDADGDGSASTASGGRDCDDADADVYYGDGTCGAPAASCDELLTHSKLLPDGAYSIDPDGAGTGIDPFDAYCDMDGGGWTLVAKVHKYHSGTAYDEPNNWFSTLRDESALLDDVAYADRTPGQASHGAARLDPLGDVSAQARFVFIAEDDDNQRVEYFKALADDWTLWMSDTAHATTQVCTNELMTENCSEGDILGGAGLTTNFDGMSMNLVGYSGGVWHMRQNNDASPSYSSLCSSTGNADGNAWNDDAIDGHWGNGMEIWVK